MPQNTGMPIGNTTYFGAVAPRPWPAVCECLALLPPFPLIAPVITRPLQLRGQRADRAHQRQHRHRLGGCRRRQGDSAHAHHAGDDEPGAPQVAHGLWRPPGAHRWPAARSRRCCRSPLSCSRPGGRRGPSPSPQKGSRVTSSGSEAGSGFSACRSLADHPEAQRCVPALTITRPARQLSPHA